MEYHTPESHSSDCKLHQCSWIQHWVIAVGKILFPATAWTGLEKSLCQESRGWFQEVIFIAKLGKRKWKLKPSWWWCPGLPRAIKAEQPVLGWCWTDRTWPQCSLGGWWFTVTIKMMRWFVGRFPSEKRAWHYFTAYEPVGKVCKFELHCGEILGYRGSLHPWFPLQLTTNFLNPDLLFSLFSFSFNKQSLDFRRKITFSN